MKLILVMGCGKGYGNYRSDEQRESPVFLFFVLLSLCCVSVFGFSGGILGWDPVHTTCISDERIYKIFIKLS